MNLTHVLFSPNGRIGQQEYWIGVLILIAANIISSFIPILGSLSHSVSSGSGSRCMESACTTLARALGFMPFRGAYRFCLASSAA